jgi:hypothetical protein
MSQPLTIIQLISGETLQNVMPILALRPARVISVFSETTEVFLKRKVDIENAVQVASPDPRQRPDFSHKPVRIGAESPSIQQSLEAMDKLLGDQPDAIVNYTGGTKEMSIGAWLAAQKYGRPSLYCDSPREFRSGGTGAVGFPVQLPELARSVEVATILAAQGFMQGTHWKHMSTTSARLAFGNVAFRLQQSQPELMRGLRAAIREHGIAGRGRKPNAHDLERASTRPVPVTENDLTRPFLNAAQHTGLMQKRGGAWYLLVSKNGNFKQRTQRLQFVIMQLDGGAYEGYVHKCLDRSGRFSRFLHGVLPVMATEEAEFGETDFLAFDPDATSLALITCKSSPPSLEHLESVLARKEKLGGRFARGVLCVESAGSRREEDIRKQAGRLGLECVIGPEIESAFRCKLSA